MDTSAAFGGGLGFGMIHVMFANKVLEYKRAMGFAAKNVGVKVPCELSDVPSYCKACSGETEDAIKQRFATLRFKTEEGKEVLSDEHVVSFSEMRLYGAHCCSGVQGPIHTEVVYDRNEPRRFILANRMQDVADRHSLWTFLALDQKLLPLFLLIFLAFTPMLTPIAIPVYFACSLIIPGIFMLAMAMTKCPCESCKPSKDWDGLYAEDIEQ